MKHEDLSFTVTDENGEEIINDITKIIPNEKNSEEPYIIFTDYTLDSNENFIEKYGKLVQEEDSFFIETNLSSMEIDYIKKISEDEVVQYVNDAIEENLHE